MNKLRDNLSPVALPDGWSGYLVSRALVSSESWVCILSTLCTSPDSLPGVQRLKCDPDSEVLRVDIALDDRHRDIVCKHHRASGSIARVVARFRPSRARRNAERALALMDMGIDTAAPLAILERKSPRPESWLITEFVPDLLGLDRIALRELPHLTRRDARRLKNGLVETIAALLQKLHLAGLTHRDFKASNILMGHTANEDPRDSDGISREGRDVCRTANEIRHAAKGLSYTAWLLDLDGLQSVSRPKLAARLRPIIRLTASLSDSPWVTRGDLARLIRLTIRDADLPNDDWRNAYRFVSHQAFHYSQASRQRKKNKLDGYV